MNVELQCKMSLLSVGVPRELVQGWYEAIYLNPDPTSVLPKIGEHIVTITDSDILDLLVIYGEEGYEAAIQEMSKYFARLYDVGRDLPLVEVAEAESLACMTGFDGRVLTDLFIGMNPRACRLLDGAALMVVMAHELWHAWQATSAAKWLEELCGTRFDFSVDPKDARHELLYYLNYNGYLGLGSPEDAYGGQILEREAYIVDKLMLERIRRFSEKTFRGAMQSLSLACQCVASK